MIVGTYRIQTDLIHDRDTSLLSIRLQLLHSRRDVRSRHDILLGANSGLDDLGVVGVGNERDDEIDLLELLVESGGVVDVEGDGLGVLSAGGKLLGVVEVSGRCRLLEFSSVTSMSQWKDAITYQQ